MVKALAATRPRKPRVPKLEDVAARAGVSTATVSRFYNNPGVVAPRTARRIRTAIKRTGYLPNALAGGLASNRSRVVAVLVPEIAQSIFNETIEAMCAELANDGIVVMLGLTGAGNERLRALIEAAVTRRADGVILTALISSEAIRTLLRQRCPVVIETWGLPDDPIDVAVGFSHDAVGAELAQFVAQRGYRRPHLVVGDGQRARQRRAGFVRAWAAAGGAAPPEIITPLPTQFGHARLVWRNLVELPQRPDVVVCGSDILAQGVIVEAHAAGLRVPDDIAVIGFGNLRVASDMQPAITTVDVDGARIGREAVAMLRSRAAGQRPPARLIDVGFRIIARESA
ncbi:MAG: LacI family DNA-binding transcriptional regulator [Gammaproteobacteria bacterium]|nr:LacI family DNA-binding transcriptional regulator [Gammaproteobacteria bacterium]